MGNLFLTQNWPIVFFCPNYIENYPCSCALLCKRAFHNMTIAQKGAAGIIFDILPWWSQEKVYLLFTPNWSESKLFIKTNLGSKKGLPSLDPKLV